MDISKCTNEDCTKKENCHRYTCEVDRHQSYCKFEPVDGECEFYLPNKK